VDDETGSSPIRFGNSLLKAHVFTRRLALDSAIIFANPAIVVQSFSQSKLVKFLSMTGLMTTAVALDIRDE
jgi:hypothetical protein